MTPEARNKLSYFQSRMSLPGELRAFRHHYQHRAEILERDWKEYEGLALALETWVKAQLSARRPSGRE